MTLENSVAFNDEDVAENEDSDDKYDYACQIIKRKHESLLRHLEQSERGENDLPVLVEEDENAKSGHLEITGLHKSSDGAILSREDDAFSITQNISPILKDDKGEDYDAFPNESIYEEGFREATKRKRPEDDSLDSISFMSVESTKKPKLSRAGSLTKNLRRRMSMTIVNPINSFFRPRRSTVDADTSSYSNFETTFNESIKEPIKEKFRQIKDKVCKPSKKDLTTPKSKKTRMQMASANMSILQDVTIKTPEKGTFDFTQVEFKTPKAPLPSASGASSSKVLRNRFKIEDASASFIDNVDNAKMVFINLVHRLKVNAIDVLIPSNHLLNLLPILNLHSVLYAKHIQCCTNFSQLAWTNLIHGYLELNSIQVIEASLSSLRERFWIMRSLPVDFKLIPRSFSGGRRNLDENRKRAWGTEILCRESWVVLDSNLR